MERVIYIEILDRRGRVKERVRLARLPATLGRAYSNDVIVEDRFVSPEHCALRDNGPEGILVEDLDSLNGLSPVPGGERVSSLALRSGDRFRCGETVLRFVLSGHPVAPAEPLARDEGGLLHALRSPARALLVVAASFAVLALDQYLSAYYETELLEIVSPAILELGALALWAGVWAFATRLVTHHHFDFLRHFACASLASVASTLVTACSGYAEFLFSSEKLGLGIELVGQAVTMAALIAAQLSIIPASSRQRRRLWATGGALVLLGLLALVNAGGGSNDVSEIPARVPLKALGGNWIPAVSTEKFLDQARSVREWADEKAAEDGR